MLSLAEEVTHEEYRTFGRENKGSLPPNVGEVSSSQTAIKMRLLSTQNWEMKDFLSDADVPPYAILSHTWDDEEVTLQQWENRHTVDISDLKGFKKIKTFGELAAVNSFQWVWVDTYEHLKLATLFANRFIKAAVLTKRAVLSSRNP